jgi:hypothetical protein
MRANPQRRPLSPREARADAIIAQIPAEDLQRLASALARLLISAAKHDERADSTELIDATP